MCDTFRNWRLIIAYVWMLYANGISEIIERPLDAEVLLGDSTYFNCSIVIGSGDIAWLHYAVGERSKHPKRVYAYGNLIPPYDKRFRIEKDSALGSANLILTEAKIEDAGLYVCQNGGRGQHPSAQLIILETSPTCQTNIHTDGFIGPNSCGLQTERIHLSCSINFKGNIPPHLQWTRVKHDGSVAINESLSSSCNVTEGRVICSYTEESDIAIDGSHFVCQTNASKRPQYTCTTNAVKILSAIGDESRMKVTVGDSVKCSANTSSLQCTYKWIWFDDADEATVSDTDSLTIEKDGWHRCRITCKIKNHQCRFVTMMVNADEYQMIIPHWTSIVLLVLWCLSVPTIAIFVILWRKKKSKDTSPYGQQQEPVKKVLLEQGNEKRAISSLSHTSSSSGFSSSSNDNRTV